MSDETKEPRPKEFRGTTDDFIKQNLTLLAQASVALTIIGEMYASADYYHSRALGIRLIEASDTIEHLVLASDRTSAIAKILDDGYDAIFKTWRTETEEDEEETEAQS